jgi:hypothetical protein
MSSLPLHELGLGFPLVGASKIRELGDYPDGVCKYHTVDPQGNDPLSGTHVFHGTNGKRGYSKKSCDAARAAWKKGGVTPGSPPEKDRQPTDEQKWCRDIPPGKAFWCESGHQTVAMAVGVLLLVIMILKK